MQNVNTRDQSTDQKSVVHLDELVDHLSPEDQEIFHRLFQVTVTTGTLVPPDHMGRWIERYFGSVEAVREQRVVKVTNKYTLESTLFNELRARRPLEARIPAELADEIAKSAPDPFCEPELNTPEDSFGRIRGRHSITAGNIAKYDGYHGVIIFNDHDPLSFSEETVIDALEVSRKWYDQCHALDAGAVYPFYMWNCLWKSGASIPHGHAQLSMTKDMHYGKVERARRSAAEYRELYDASYFDDVYRLHEQLGIGWETGNIRVMANITPLKEKELVLQADAVTPELGRSIYKALRCMVEDLSVVSFNLAIWEGPLSDDGNEWGDFPVTVRIVDRGDPLNRTSDFGAMELYAASVVSSDPFRVADSLRGHFV